MVHESIPAQLRAWRLQTGESLAAAGRRTRIPPVVIASYERGDRQPPLDRAIAWVAGFGHQLVAVPPGHHVVPVDAGPETTVHTQWAVRIGSEVVPVQSRYDALIVAVLADLADGAEVLSRQVRVTEWKNEDRHE